MLAARLFDLAKAVSDSNRIACGKFLTPAEALFMKNAAKQARINIVFDGGYEGAERTIPICVPEEVAPVQENPNYPICALKITPRAKHHKIAEMTHRDILGSVLSLGLERQVIGDIIVGKGCATMLIHCDISKFLQESLIKVGSQHIDIEPCEPSSVQKSEEEGKEIAFTVSSPRLDAVVAKVYGLSRERAKELVSAQMVSLNHICKTQPETNIKTGDMLSVRGKGRFRVLKAEDMTKKGKLRILGLIIR